MSKPTVHRSDAERLLVRNEEAVYLSARVPWAAVQIVRDRQVRGRGNVVCFFPSGYVDKERYSSVGFTPEPNLDENGVWPISFAVTELNDTTETTITELVQKAVG